MKFVSVRELSRNMKGIARQVNFDNQEFQVTKNSQPLFIIIPNKKLEAKKKKYNVQDVLKLSFKSNESKKELASEPMSV